MSRLFSFAAAGLALLAGESVAQAQYFHGHMHYHRGHIDYHGHWHYPTYSSPSYYGGYPVLYGSSGFIPTSGSPLVMSNPSVFSTPAPVVTPGVIPTSGTALKPNPLPPYNGPGVTIWLPAEFPNSVFLRINQQDIELKAGNEATLKDKPSCIVEYDRGGNFGAARHELTEGRYRFAVGPKGWMLVPDAGLPSELRPNPLPGAPKKE